MKALILLFSLLTFGSSSVWADNLLPDIQIIIESQNLLAFSSQGVSFKECNNCVSIKLNPQKKVGFYEQNTPIELQEATELFVSKKYESISIFYNRNTNAYYQIVFGGFIEIEPIPLHPNLQ